MIYLWVTYWFTQQVQEFFTWQCIKISTRTGEGQQNLSLCSKLMATEQGGIFMVPRPQRNYTYMLRLIDWLFDFSRFIGSIFMMYCCSGNLTRASFDWPLASFWRFPIYTKCMCCSDTLVYFNSFLPQGLVSYHDHPNK